ncbi:hypothetical protein GPECTOR_32g523 [Gonium pectorale]|uniref:Uncharacterized protein n=1 Tax=Gonium pectorale TaxID=33097 RepID=A0A150GEZ7_GONPE|nr:hypothetical protein GPECTOR_32g523 [Gonium pectorale]|eukprot:KXZ47910.1 hypothetical protein GPECTOR_32g523 [Gonium pectorale]
MPYVLSFFSQLPVPEPSGATAEGGGASGVLVTAAKRASALARQLEELAEAGDGGGGGSMAEIFKPPSAVLDIAISGAAIIRDELRRRQQAVSPGDGGLAPKAGRAASACRAHDARPSELLAMSMRSACHLAAQLAAAAIRSTAAAARSSKRVSVSREDFGDVVMKTGQTLHQLTVTLSCPAGGWGLTAEQLIACQPHRLLTAGAALLRAIRPDARNVQRALLVIALSQALVALATSQGLGHRFQAWLAPPGAMLPNAAAAAAVDPAERGCHAWSGPCAK